MNKSWRTLVLAAGCVFLLTGASLIFAAEPEAKAPAVEDENLIQLNFPPTVDLQMLIEYVSKRLSINILYDEAIGRTRVTLISPAKIRKDALLPLLQSVLSMNNMELVDSTPPGWKVVGRKPTVRFVAVKNASASDLAKQVGMLLDERERIASGAGGGTSALGSPAASGRPIPIQAARGARATLIADPRTNQIAIVAGESAADEAQKLIEALDVVGNLTTHAYRFRFVTPARIDHLVRGRVTAMGFESSYTATIDEVSGLLLVTAPPRVHAEIEGLAAELDVEADPNRSYVRFYKLINTTASEVLATLRSLRGDDSGTKSEARAAPAAMPEGFTGPNLPPPAPGMISPLPPAYRAGNGGAGASPAGSLSLAASDQTADKVPLSSEAAALGQDAVITSDANTNSIIVIAPPETQKVFQQLISALDKRRPQVLVEVTLVTLTATDDFTLGVELGAAGLGGNKESLIFSSFGLSLMDLATGVPGFIPGTTLVPGAGFNGIVVGGDTLSAVIHALAESSHSKILSAPKVLVNDNATAKLESISESPYTSLNASATVSTTSFAGYAAAGTTVTVRPHISEGEHLQLKYTITVNSFTGTGADGVPPPRATDSVNSEVTVPNGFAVIAGGLKRSNRVESSSKIPFLGDIPILKYLFGINSKNSADETLFVFIRPVILRDDKFEDLKYLSDRDLEVAKLPPNLPVSAPLIME